MHPALEGRGAVVTGAGGGIGRALAARLVAEGARVVVNDVDEAACRATADELGATAVPGDCASDAGVRALVDAATDALGRVDVYCANAGIDRTIADPLALSDDDWAAMLEVNLMGHVRAARALVPGWVEDGVGRPVRRHRVGRGAAHDDRRRRLLRHQARRRRVRRVALGHLRRPRRHRAGHLPAGRAHRDARAGRAPRRPALPRRRAHAGGRGRRRGWPPSTTTASSCSPTPRWPATTPPAPPTPIDGWRACGGSARRWTPCERPRTRPRRLPHAGTTASGPARSPAT